MNRIGLISYNFPHRKTQDFIFRLLAEGYDIGVILAQNYKELNIQPSSIRSSVRYKAVIHPRSIAKNLDIDYCVVDHDSAEMVELIEEYDLDIGIISGARILKSHVIRAFNLGIINFHPGLLPEARGLDALKWSILNNIPAGISAHIIDKKIDAGKVLLKKQIEVESGDTFLDLNEKIYSQQLNSISKSIQKLLEDKFMDISFVSTDYNSKMSSAKEKEVMNMLPAYIKRFSNQKS